MSEINRLNLENFRGPEYTLAQKDMALISKYTEIAKVAQNVDLAADELEYCITANRIKISPDLNSASVVGQKIEKEKHLDGYQIGNLDDMDNGIISQVGRAIEVDFEKNIGVKKKIMAKKYRPKVRLSEQTKLEKAKEKRQRMLEYAKKNSVKEKKAKLDKRQKVHEKYTHVDPETKKRVRREMEKNSYSLVPRNHDAEFCRYCANKGQCHHCDINPYVVEQVRAKLLKNRRNRIDMKVVMETDNFEVIEQEVKNSSGSKATENRMQRLVNIVNLMDVCLQEEEKEITVIQERPMELTQKRETETVMSDLGVQVCPIYH